MKCKIKERDLQAWFDTDPEEQSETMSSHVEECETCMARLEGWIDTHDNLVHMVDEGLGEVEPLVALQQIRRRITDAEEGSLRGRLLAMWNDMWTFNRRALAGVAVAAMVGALCAPGAMWLAGTKNGGSAPLASVVVESLEFDGNAKAVVYRPNEGNTTLIWVEPASGYGEQY